MLGVGFVLPGASVLCLFSVQVGVSEGGCWVEPAVGWADTLSRGEEDGPHAVCWSRNGGTRIPAWE